MPANNQQLGFVWVRDYNPRERFSIIQRCTLESLLLSTRKNRSKGARNEIKCIIVFSCVWLFLAKLVNRTAFCEAIEVRQIRRRVSLRICMHACSVVYKSRRLLVKLNSLYPHPPGFSQDALSFNRQSFTPLISS